MLNCFVHVLSIFVFSFPRMCVYQYHDLCLSILMLCVGREVIKLFSCSTQLSIKFILLIMLIFISRINTASESF